MQFSDAAGNSAARRSEQSLLLARADDVAVNHRQGKLLPLQIAFADQPVDHRFHRWGQPAASAAAARSVRNQIRDSAGAAPVPADQHVNLPTRHTQKRGGIIDCPLPDNIQCSQGRNHRSLSHGSIPLRIGHGQQAPLNDRRFLVSHAGNDGVGALKP
jgi:hypothetical protein